jgi:hypothetical protein
MGQVGTEQSPEDHHTYHHPGPGKSDLFFQCEKRDTAAPEDA